MYIVVLFTLFNICILFTSNMCDVMYYDMYYGDDEFDKFNNFNNKTSKIKNKSLIKNRSNKGNSKIQHMNSFDSYDIYNKRVNSMNSDEYIIHTVNDEEFGPMYISEYTSGYMSSDWS